MRLFSTMLLCCTCVLAMAQDMPSSMYYSSSDHTLYTGKQASDGLYDESVIRDFQLWFAQTNYWQLLTTNYANKVDIPATLVVGSDTFFNVGVRFKGNTSYNMIGSSQKKSFNITMDYQDPNQNLMGYETINLNNCFDDASFMREYLYAHQIRQHVPAVKASYVRLSINGVSWGLYPNVQQLDGEYTKEWFFSNDGTRWRADKPAGSPGGPGGGGPSWGDGTAGMNYLGADTTTYKAYYTLKSTKKNNPWDDLVNTCKILNQTPLDSLEAKLAPVLDIDRTLWFLASEIAFSDDDSYVFKGKMDYFLYWDAETGRITPLEFDGNTCMKSNTTNWNAFYNANKVNYPLLNRILAVPNLRQRYLAHLRTIIADEMDSATFNALVDQTDALIAAAVQADTKKLYTVAQYTADKQTLKSFVQSHRTTLQTNAEVNTTAPIVSDTDMQSNNGTWANPSTNEGVQVTVTATHDSGLSAVWLYHCPSLYGNFLKIQMFDDGAHSDGAAGDNVFGADIQGYNAGTFVRFYVEAKANTTAGTAAYLPKGAEHDVYMYQVGAIWADQRPVVINEIMAANQSTVQDENTQYEDWIELYNTTENTVDLSGFFLTDDLQNLEKWAIPDGTTIAGKGYKIIWADEDGSDGPFHCNFKLSASGESLALLDSEKRFVDTIQFSQQVVDKGYARVPNGTGSFFIQNPTFGANNEGVSATTAPYEVTDMHVYPNPAKQRVVVALKGDFQSNKLLIYNVMGQVVTQLDPKPYQEIDLSLWPSGLYFLQCGSLVKRLTVADK